MKVLLSIKPKYADLIFSGVKHYEYRRVLFQVPSIKKIIVYAPRPVSKIIGEFKIDTTITSDIADLWKKTKNHAGIDKDFYQKYFKGLEIGHAIKIKNPKKYRKHKELKDFNIEYAPQSFIYID